MTRRSFRTTLACAAVVLSATPWFGGTASAEEVGRIEGVQGATAVHLCFGYGSMVKNKPAGYAFLPELEATAIDQVSIETAQSKLDCAALARLPTKQIILGVIDLQDVTVETPATVAERIRRALPYVSPDRLVVAPDCGLKYLPRDVAFAKLKAMVEGAAIVRRELTQ